MRHILSALCWLLLAGPAAGQTAPQPVTAPLSNDPLQATVHRLSNGLTVYLSPNHQEPRISAHVIVRAGSKQDPDDATGLAHYLEHMLFKGSSQLGTLDYSKEKPYLDHITDLYEQLFVTQDPAKRKDIFAQIDAENIKAVQYAVPNEIDKLYNTLGFDGVNAHTSHEETEFVCNFPANRAEVWARVESDRFAHAVFRLFESELEAVYEEKNRTMDNAERVLDEALEKQLFKVHPYGQHTTIGTIEHLKNPSLAKMYSFYKTYYRPNNMALVLSGDFDRQALLSVLEKYFGTWTPAPLPPAKQWPLPKPNRTERVQVRYEAEEKGVIAWPTAPNKSPDVEPIMVMDMLIDNAQAGILNLNLNQAQKVKASGSYPLFYNDAGAWYTWVLPKKGQTLQEAEALLLEAIDILKGGQFTEDDIRAIITDFEVNEKLQLESNDARVAKMAESFITDEEWPYTIGRLDRLRQVTKADVLRVAAKYLGPDRVIAYRVNGKPDIPSIQKPHFTEISIDPSRKSPFFSELLRMPAKPIEPRWVEAGLDYQILELPWGKLYAARNPMNDLFEITFRFDRGYRQDRDICAALDLLELSGGGKLSADAYKKTLYALGTKMGISCGEDESAVTLSGLDAHFDQSLDLMLQRFDAPNIAADTLTKMIEVQIGQHSDNKKKPGYISMALGEYAMRGKDSAVLAQLSDNELRALKEPDLRKLIESFFDYKRRALYVGIRDPKAILPLLSAAHKDFKTPQARAPRSYQKPEKPRLLFTHRDMVQSLVGLYAADTLYDPSRAVDYKFYETYMGGMSGVLFQEVRESRALAYSVHGGYTLGERKGDENYLWGEAGCQSDKTLETATLLGNLLNKFPASPDRFSETFKSVEEEYRTDVVTFRQIPGAVVYWEELGLNGDPRPKNFQKALRYTLNDLAGFAKHFESKPMTFYMLGNRGRMDLEAMKPLGALEEKPLDALFPY